MTKRLGVNATIERQIERYAGLARKKRTVSEEEVLGLLRLVSRRQDARKAFADAGARAARRAVQENRNRLLVLVPGKVRRKATMRLARGLLAQLLGARFEPLAGTYTAGIDHDLPTRAAPDGSACVFYGSAIAEILRELDGFEGAMFHVECRARGGDRCVWSSEERGQG